MPAVRKLPGTTLPEARRGTPASDELTREIESLPLWMYRWEHSDGAFAPTNKPEDTLVHIHETRLKMLEADVKRAIEEAGPGARVLDLACNEGWFAHRMLDWGADYVLGIDIREVNVRRAKLIADRYGISPEKFEVRQGDIYDLDPVELGRFDVVLLLGLVYHVEDPMGAVRRAASVCDGVCVIEAQLQRQDTVEWSIGPHVTQAPASFAVYVEADAETNPVASDVGIMSLIPNRAALETMPRVAGFGHVRFCEPHADAEEQYLRGDRGQVVAWQPGKGPAAKPKPAAAAGKPAGGKARQRLRQVKSKLSRRVKG